ncbi:hypothetical protein CCAX7_44110 [Capsulimonas corticalis]|uniref:Uncharacterized protein n=1 Tax=Capsulimonas corticalis TaxID=2219043 RepID=A0A402CX81_9BACT|nr:hypothetical protein CCAX7_44110 [Capsulimonas corticalis]
MIAITTRSSINVKPVRFMCIRPFLLEAIGLDVNCVSLFRERLALDGYYCIDIANINIPWLVLRVNSIFAINLFFTEARIPIVMGIANIPAISLTIGNTRVILNL